MNFLKVRRERSLVKADSEFLGCMTRGMDGGSPNKVEKTVEHSPVTIYCLWDPLPWNLPKPWVRYQSLGTK